MISKREYEHVSQRLRGAENALISGGYRQVSTGIWRAPIEPISFDHTDLINVEKGARIDAQREILTVVLELLNLSDAYSDITTEVEVPDTVYLDGGYRLPMGTKKVTCTDKGVDRFRDDLLAAKDALHGEAALKKIRAAVKENKK